MKNLLEKLLCQAEKNVHYQEIMADQVVELSEFEAQAQRVDDLIVQAENQLSDADFELVTNLISEMGVLFAISKFQNKY